jgi:hypothetical protein
MKAYSILFAQDVPHYGTAEIVAANDAEALAQAKALDLGELCTDPAWDDPVCRRIVHIEDPAGKIIAQDVALDDFFLRHAQNIEPQLCDAASALKAALESIAAIPLWEERIENAELKAELVERGEYEIDGGEEQFTPSGDTESSQLREAVETAREALAAMRRLS